MRQQLNVWQPKSRLLASNKQKSHAESYSCEIALASHPPLQVIINGSQSMHAVSEAGVSVRSAAHKEMLQLKTWDASLVSPGNPTPFPNGLFQPEMDKGVHFNLMNNIWGTNYVSAVLVYGVLAQLFASPHAPMGPPICMRHLQVGGDTHCLRSGPLRLLSREHAWSAAAACIHTNIMCMRYYAACKLATAGTLIDSQQCLCIHVSTDVLQVMWVPYTDDDVNLAFRFSIHAEQL
jgi:hypothetical protein